jgi:hypothetical protein
MTTIQIVMIIMFTNPSPGGGVAISEHAFASMAACQKAVDLAMKVPVKVGNAYAFCIEPGRQ